MSDPLPVLLIVVCVAVAVVVALAVRTDHRDTGNRAFSRIADEFQGTLQRGTIFGEPSVTFQHRGLTVRLDVHATGGNHRVYYTQLHFLWPERRLRCEVYPTGFLDRLGALLGVTDVEVGSPQFDSAYTVTGNRYERIRELLSAGVQTAIGQLRRVFGNDDIYVSFSSGKLLIKKRGFVRQPDELLQFVRLGLELYDAASGAGSEGIAFVETEVAAMAGDLSSGEPICQVCGEPITEQSVVCRACRTPHHEECWRYNGACSTYGCGERRCLRGDSPAPRRSA